MLDNKKINGQKPLGKNESEEGGKITKHSGKDAIERLIKRIALIKEKQKNDEIW